MAFEEYMNMYKFAETQISHNQRETYVEQARDMIPELVAIAGGSKFYEGYS
jgi:hypothetical protein